ILHHPQLYSLRESKPLGFGTINRTGHRHDCCERRRRDQDPHNGRKTHSPAGRHCGLLEKGGECSLPRAQIGRGGFLSASTAACFTLKSCGGRCSSRRQISGQSSKTQYGEE
ncbi:unnamed protein product, partial [Ectocarpus sp. 12 AP-2014]